MPSLKPANSSPELQRKRPPPHRASRTLHNGPSPPSPTPSHHASTSLGNADRPSSLQALGLHLHPGSSTKTVHPPGHILTFFTRQLLLDLQDSAWNFRDGPRVQNLPANAGDTGSILHAVEQLTHAPQLLCLCSGAWRCNYGSLCSATREATAVRSPTTATRESLHTAVKIQQSQK